MNFSPRLWSRSQLQQIVNCSLHFGLWKTNSPKTFYLKCVSPSFSCLIVTCLITKSKKQNIHICKMVQDYHRKLSTFPQLFVTSFSIEVNYNISWKCCVPFQIQAKLCFWSISQLNVMLKKIAIRFPLGLWSSSQFAVHSSQVENLSLFSFQGKKFPYYYFPAFSHLNVA